MKKRIRVNEIKLPIDSGINELKEAMSKLLGMEKSRFIGFEITKKAVDARDKGNIFLVFAAELELDCPKNVWDRLLRNKKITLCEKRVYSPPGGFYNPAGFRPVVVGCGPAGIFAALVLAEAGLAPIIIERGKPVDERMADIAAYMSGAAPLNPESNALFGEGGAGAFSDGKLTTGIKDARIAKVIDELSQAGAGDEIRYDSKPHIGTDRLTGALKNIRGKILSLGGEFRFNTKMTGVAVENGALAGIETEGPRGREEIGAEFLILAMGHSARDTLEKLYSQGVRMEQKPFSVGVRIEHSQAMISAAQYGAFAQKLPPADYKLNAVTKTGRGVYTFCMCPGGFVIPAMNEPGCLCVNGMSESERGGENANAALLVSVFPADYCFSEADEKNPLAGINFQKKLERAAFDLGGGKGFAPVTLAGDFLAGRASAGIADVTPSFRPGYTPADISLCLNEFISDALREAIIKMGAKLKGFASPGAVLTAVETRSSSPVKIIRSGDYFASIKGLIPVGEGGGFAGGIVSAAVDGIKGAEALCGHLAERREG